MFGQSTNFGRDSMYVIPDVHKFYVKLRFMWENHPKTHHSSKFTLQGRKQTKIKKSKKSKMAQNKCDKGRCSLGYFCRCPTGLLIAKNLCVGCGVQLHSTEQGCGDPCGDGNVQCPLGTGCRKIRDRNKNKPSKPVPEKKQPSKPVPEIANTSTTSTSKPYRKREVEKDTDNQPTKKKRHVRAGRRRGLKEGKNLTFKKLLEDWYYLCKKYREKKTYKQQSKFLKSTLSGENVSGTLQEQQTFSRYLRQYDNKKLLPSQSKKNRNRAYQDIEMKLIDYIDLRGKNYKMDKCGLSWVTLRNKSLQFADLLGYDEEEFKASDGWISNTLKRNGKVGITCHGEANDMTEEHRKKIMKKWLKEFHELIEEKKIEPSCLYNADQTGLYYQKLPNRMYVTKKEKRDFKGVKQMKSKTRVTLMVCTSASGEKVPLSVVGNVKKPVCFQLTNPPPFHILTKRVHGLTRQ